MSAYYLNTSLLDLNILTIRSLLTQNRFPGVKKPTENRELKNMHVGAASEI